LALTNWKNGERRQQHDAQEFLVHFLDQVSKAAMTLEICATDHRTCVRCGDQSETITLMALFDVAITATTVQGCIDNHMTDEVVDYKCPSLSCSGSQSTRSVKLAINSGFLLCLKRNINELAPTAKNPKRVVLKKVIAPVQISAQVFLSGNYYDVQAVIMHTGTSASSGHYFAFKKHASKGWLRHDDSCVTQASWDMISDASLQPSLYMLAFRPRAAIHPATSQASELALDQKETQVELLISLSCFEQFYCSPGSRRCT
jgi:ubiquitin C-terminal hydrolase